MTGNLSGTPGPLGPGRELSAGAFNNLLAAFERVRVPLAQTAAQSAAEHEREAVRQLIEGHITDAGWRSMLHKAREAAETGKRQCLLLRFPSGDCSDGGRAVMEQEPGWGGTLGGDAAAVFRRWKADLAPHGFTLTARVLEFPGGVPGDVGLFLGWRD